MAGRPALVAALALALCSSALSSTAHGGERHVLHGLFCNTEAQIDEALAGMRRNLTLRAAAELANRETVACVYADAVQYIVTDPFMLDATDLREPLVKYGGTLVGVRVGENNRAVEPPVRIYFLSPERLAGAVSVRGA